MGVRVARRASSTGLPLLPPPQAGLMSPPSPVFPSGLPGREQWTLLGAYPAAAAAPPRALLLPQRPGLGGRGFWDGLRGAWKPVSLLGSDAPGHSQTN